MSKLNKNAKNSQVETSNVETSNELNVAGLETAKNETVISKRGNSVAPEYTDIEFLNSANPEDYFTPENISSKFDAEREVKIASGLAFIGTLKINDKTINPLLLLLGKWWEVKPARAVIKKMLVEEAATKGFASDVYVQIELKKEINLLAEMTSSIDRLKYATTYFKPRKPLSNKVIMKQVTIGNKLYNVSVQALIEAKEKFGTDADGLREHILSIAIPLENEIEEL